MYCIIVLFAVYYILCTSVHMYWYTRYVRVYICTGTLVRGATEEASAMRRMDLMDGWSTHMHAQALAAGRDHVCIIHYTAARSTRPARPLAAGLDHVCIIHFASQLRFLYYV